MLTPVSVAVLRDIGRVYYEGKHESFSRGEEAVLPLWIAEALPSSLELREQTVKDHDIANYSISEESSRPSDLVPLKRTFYYEAAKLITRLRSSSDSKDLAKADRVEADLMALMKRRLNKIMRLAFLGAEVEDIADKLTPEEIALFLELKDSIEAWERGVALGRH